VRQTAARFQAIVEELGATLPPLLPNYRVKILDGNALAGTQHRIKELRSLAAGRCRVRRWEFWIRSWG